MAAFSLHFFSLVCISALVTLSSAQTPTVNASIFSNSNATSSTNSTTPPPYTVVNNQTTQSATTTDTPTTKPGIYDCQLGSSSHYRETLGVILGGPNKLVEVEIFLEGYPEDMLDKILIDVYKPRHWVRASKRQGHSLLMLEESYSYMSLTTLSIGVEHMSANITSHPPNCLVGLHRDDLLEVIRRSFLNDFKVLSKGDASGSMSADEHICNYHIGDHDGYARFHYECCRVDPDNHVHCETIVRNKWLKVLLALVTVIKIIVVLFSPLIIPESMYRLKFVAAQYRYHVPAESPPISMKVVVTDKPAKYGEENKHKRVRLSQLKNMEVFKAMVSSSRWQQDKVHEVKVKDARLSVKSRRLLAKSSLPVTITKIIYNNLLRCHIKRLKPLAACCDANILGKFNSGLKVIKWSHLMRILAGFILMLLLFIPWIIRVVVYLSHDRFIYKSREEAAIRAGLEPSHTSSLVIYLSPLHVLFVFIYVIFIVDSVVYGTISKPMKEKLKFVLRQCLRDMRERSRLAVLGWLVELLVWPFKTCGLLGIIVFPVYLVIILIITLPIIIFYVFPTVNLSMRLIIHCFIFMCPSRFSKKFEDLAHKLHGVREKMKLDEVTANETFIKRSDYTPKGIAFQLVVIIMCLISFWSVTLLVMEVCSFFVELLVYTFMGIIVNAASTMKFVTVFFLLYLYGKGIFNSVSKEYQAYHQIIHAQLLSMKRADIDEIAKLESMEQENTAFRVTGTMALNLPKRPEPYIKVKEHQPHWSTTGMLLFLDNMDNVMTPDRFYFDTIDLNYGGCPGPVYKQIIDAMIDFSRVILFLLFVFLVVMAFGDAYQVSTTNQLLATVAGGFVPFLFRFIFKASSSGPDVDTSSIQFLTEFHKVINAYQQSWPVYDIQPDTIEEYDEHAKDAKPVVDGNGNGNRSVADPDSSTTPLMNSTVNDSDSTKHEHAVDMEHATSSISIIDDDTPPEVDIIVDVSTPKTRSMNAMFTTGFEKGSVTMIDPSYRTAAPAGGSARIYKPPVNERAIDVV